MNNVAKENKLLELAQAMRSDPLSRIMYGGRELFHSNFLAWLCEEYPAFSQAISDLVPGRTAVQALQVSKLEVRREWMNLDLYMEWAGSSPLAIENKVFSIPGTDQLDKYAVKLRKTKSGDSVRAALLSLSSPGWSIHQSPGNPAIDWHHVSYGQLAEALEMSLANHKVRETYELETIRRYIALIRRLQDIADLLQVSDESEPVFIGYWSSIDAIDDRQFVSSASKLRAQIVSRYVEERLPDDSTNRQFTAEMSNATPLIQARYSQRSHHYGWQLQGQQLRLFAVLPDLEGRTEKLRSERIAWGLKNPALFDFSKIVPLTGEAERAVIPNDSFNRFDPNFIYRYISVPDLTVGQLVAIAQQSDRN